MSALVAVVGPSGVGKDSILQYAAARLSSDQNFHFVKRSITRPADSGGEDHKALSIEEFDAHESDGEFVIAWQAHGLKYGIPKSAKEFVDKGGVAVVNGSRHAMHLFAATFENLIIVSIVAEPKVIVERLRSRGRESDEEILMRLEREKPELEKFGRVLTLDNSGKLADAGDRFLEQLFEIKNSAPNAKHKAAEETNDGSFNQMMASAWPFL